MKEISCRELLESEAEKDQLLAILRKREGDFWGRLREKIEKLDEGKEERFLMELLTLARLRKDVYNEVVRLYEEVTRMPIVIDKSRDPLYIEGRKMGRRERRLEAYSRDF